MTKPASPVSATARYRVDRTAKEDRLSGGWHHHIVALCLADGRLVPKAEAIANIREAIEGWAETAAAHGQPIPDEDFDTQVVCV